MSRTALLVAEGICAIGAAGAAATIGSAEFGFFLLGWSLSETTYLVDIGLKIGLSGLAVGVGGLAIWGFR